MTSEQIAARRPVASTARFDRTSVRFNQAAIIAFLVAGFLFNLPWLVVFVAVVMALGTGYPPAALFQRIYRDILRPAKLLQPDLHDEDAAPHRFAQGMGAGVLILSILAFLAGSASLGWALALLVSVLAAVNLVFGFCAGCFVYFQLQRLGLIAK
ncbi:MAG: DUF4395 domain-containing protein [Chloroflexi bacterium]|nr:DUF4395 domain-containing protein [Chloroflexota bacterium]